MKMKNFLVILLALASTTGFGAVSEADKALGRRLKKAQQDGLLIAEGTFRGQKQIDQLIEKGFILVGTKELNISKGLHRLLNNLLDNAIAEHKTFGIMSLAAERGPHGGGTFTTTRAVDISVFNNYSLSIDQYSGVLLALEDFLAIMPPLEHHKMGLPRTAYKVGEEQRSCEGGLKDGNYCDRKKYSYRIDQAVFDNPQAYDYFIPAQFNEKFPARTGRTPENRMTIDLPFVVNDEYQRRLTEATLKAKAEKVVILGWFADSMDHLHVSVETNTQALP